MNQDSMGKPAAGAARPLGLYVHVPFCSRPCDYCAFYQVQTDRDGIRRYLDNMRREAELAKCGRDLDTMFWGGGTPSLLLPEALDELCGIALDAFGKPAREWTVEMAPSSVRREKLEVLKARGVNRVSMGVQSFDAAMLEELGRPHTRKQALAAYELIREVGFDSVNLDMMFAIPRQSEEALVKDLTEAMSLGPDHLSAYCLTFEEDTALYIKLSQGKLSIDPEREARLYRTAWDTFEKGGYGQYEISNYARPGKECAHNISTWEMNDWIGLGPSAACQVDGWRAANTSDLAKWGEGLARGERLGDNRQRLSDGLLFEDSLIFGLRMNAGIDLDVLQARFADAAALGRGRALLDRMVDEGLIDRSGSRYRLTDEGRMLADAIGGELVGVGEFEAE